MNKDKIKILLRLYKQDLITDNEFMILLNEDNSFIHTTSVPNVITAQPFVNNQPFNVPYYTSGTKTVDATTNTSGMNSSSIFTSPQQSTVSSSFSKKWINPEEPKF